MVKWIAVFIFCILVLACKRPQANSGCPEYVQETHSNAKPAVPTPPKTRSGSDMHKFLSEMRKYIYQQRNSSTPYSAVDPSDICSQYGIRLARMFLKLKMF
jgi:hypothetical protein